MKRVILIVSLLLCLSLFDTVQSEEISSYTIEELGNNHEDYLEIVDLNETIIGMLNDMRSYNQLEQLPDNFQLDFSEAKKIYVDTGIFSLETTNRKKITEKLNNSTYMWMLLVNIGDVTYQVNIAKGLPLNPSAEVLLSEKEIQNIKDNEGKWTVSGIEALEGRAIDYEKTVNQQLENLNIQGDTEILLCGGLEHINKPVALVANKSEVEYLVPLYDLSIEGTEKEIKQIKPDNTSPDDEVYLYDKIRDASNEMDEKDEIALGNAGGIKLHSQESMQVDNSWVFTYIVILIIGVSVVCLIRKEKLVK